MINGTQIANNLNFTSTEILIAIGTIATAVILGITLILQIRDRKPKFRYYKNKIDEKHWTIVISQSDKLIQKFQIKINGEYLLERNKKQFDATLGINEGATFEVNDNISDETNVIFEYDGETFKILMVMPSFKFL